MTSPAENAATVREALDRLFPKRLTEAAYPALDALLAKAEADENYAGYGEILEELTQRAETAEARLEHTQDALRQIRSTPSADNAIADLMRDIARAALTGEGTTTQRHGRDCRCTPCRAEDWDAIDAGLRS